MQISGSSFRKRRMNREFASLPLREALRVATLQRDAWSRMPVETSPRQESSRSDQISRRNPRTAISREPVLINELAPSFRSHAHSAELQDDASSPLRSEPSQAKIVPGKIDLGAAAAAKIAEVAELRRVPQSLSTRSSPLVYDRSADVQRPYLLLERYARESLPIHIPE